MGKDELGDALMDFSKHIHVATLSNMGGAHACESYARDAEQYLMEAKSAILAWCLKQVPEKITYNDNLDFTMECPSCGSKDYDYWSGWIKGEEGQMEPEEGYCKTCGFQWQQGGEGWIPIMMEEAKDWVEDGLYFHGRNDAVDEMKRRMT